MREELLPSMWFQPGFRDNDVIVVLNSPGREELLANRPAVGETGTNLEHLFSKVIGVDSRWPLCRRSVEIVNASRVPHYPMSPDGEYVKKGEVLANTEFAKQRFISPAIKTVLAFGVHARTIVTSCLASDTNKCVCFCRHLDKRGLVNEKLKGGQRYPWPKISRDKMCRIVEWRIECLARFIMDSWGCPGFHYAENYFKDWSK